MMDIEKLDIKPFLSILLGKNSGNDKPDDIHQIVLDIIVNENRKKVQVDLFGTNNDTYGEANIYYTPYKVTKTPGWYRGNEINDIDNHVFITFSLNGIYAFYCSEKGMKDEIRMHFHSTKLPCLEVIEMGHLNDLFVNEDSMKMLWLLSVDGKNSFKADSKVLGGNSVADTLDPLEDQSFSMSAVRTELDDGGSTIGINPFKSSLWRGPCKDWYTFESRVFEIIDKIDKIDKNKEFTSNPISILATPLNDLKHVNILYELLINECDMYFDKKNKYDLLREVNESYSFIVNDTICSNEINITVSSHGCLIGDIKVQVEVKNYLVSFSAKNSPVKGNKSKLEFFSRIFNYPDVIKCWYESGHSIVDGRLFKTDYRDVEYNDFIWADFERFKINQEKPEIIENESDIQKDNKIKPIKKVALNLIGKDNSLFCWVKNRWSGCWDRIDNFITTENPSGWLYCDDGAGEKADFIHVVEFNKKINITFIHVKASKSDSRNRRMSVGAHDVVLSQAIKNIRYTNRKNLVSALKKRVSGTNDKFCWENNISKKPDEFIEYLEGIKTQSNIKNRVVIIQPHTRKKCYENKADSNIKKLLAVLLVNADTAVKSCGAEFYIVGCDDTKSK
ncbi:TPA: hypothetical protein ACVPFL_000168 [Morganella morganii]